MKFFFFSSQNLPTQMKLFSSTNNSCNENSAKKNTKASKANPKKWVYCFSGRFKRSHLLNKISRSTVIQQKLEKELSEISSFPPPCFDNYLSFVVFKMWNRQRTHNTTEPLVIVHCIGGTFCKINKKKPPLSSCGKLTLYKNLADPEFKSFIDLTRSGWCSVI